MKQKTPIAKIIEKLKDRGQHYRSNEFKTLISFCIEDCEELLEDEKQVIIDAVNDNYTEDFIKEAKVNPGEQYYNETFNQLSNEQ